MTTTGPLAGAIALTRFGLGARAGDIAAASADPRGWLLSQIRPQGADIPLSDGQGSAERLNDFRQLQQARRQARKSGEAADAIKAALKTARAQAGADFLARARLGATTDAGFRERWALFFANHFTVSAVKGVTAPLIGPFEAEAIRPHVFGRFEDLLLASTQHPAMLLYLDQAQSFGPDSPLARRAQARSGKRVGLDENLAREIMELHTVGLEAGYSQADVTEFARALTGWSIGGLMESPDRAGHFVFRPFGHEPGARHIMGRTYAQGGEDQARAVLKDLAASPHTAHHLAFEIAAHFVADAPPPSLTAKLARRYAETGGDLAEVAQALVDAPEAWAPPPVKFKQPYEFMVSSWRAAGVVPDDVGKIAPALTALGQPPFSAPSPKGWSEDAAVWAAPDAIVKRMAWSEALAAAAAGQSDPMQLADNALGPRLTSAAAKAISRAETRAEGLSILLMSPEFQRR
ncbi:MAG TPA: DUF1800 family protein [Caulobacteraceae bacterium]|nr:DUF1800 family protein [Caulobacteraceae bacterium]